MTILAGGLGTRLGALARDLPKPMIAVGGRPFVEYLVRQLARQGFPEIIFLTGYRNQVIIDHFGTGDRFGIPIRYSAEPEPLGTGGALRLACPLIRTRFLMMYGDVYRRFDYAAFCRRHHDQCLAIYPWVDGLTTISCGNVQTDASNTTVTAYIKNDPAKRLPFVDAGFALMPVEAIELLPEGVSSFENHVYPELARRGLLECEIVDRDFFDIGNPADLARTRNELTEE